MGRKKLKTFEWTDDAIQAVSNGKQVPQFEKKSKHEDKSNGLSYAKPFVDTMEDKIARVQARKKEDQDRKIRLSKRSNVLPTEDFRYIISLIPKDVLLENIKGDESTFIAYGINTYIGTVIEKYPHLIGEYEATMPLYMYDSSEFDERIPRITAFPYDAVSLMASTSKQDSVYDRSIGKWMSCSVMGYVSGSGSESDSFLNIRLSSGEMATAHISYVFSKKQSIDLYIERVVAALKRRHDSLSLLKYYYYIRCMPFNDKIVSTMTNDQMERIHRKTLNMKRLAEVPILTSSLAMDQVIKDYEVTMNAVVFNAFMLSKSYSSSFQGLNVPKDIFGITLKKVPQCALFDVPQYNIKARINTLQTQSLLGAKAAIEALHVALGESLSIENFQILNITFPKTLTLEKFERSITEQMVTAVRYIKQEWPMRTSMGIRNAMISLQDHPVVSAAAQIPLAQILQRNDAPLSGRPMSKGLPQDRPASRIGSASLNPMDKTQKVLYYDMSIRNVHNYEKPAVSIRYFLDRVNFMMSDVLTNIVKDNLTLFTQTVKDLCSSEIEVQDIRNIIVRMPADSIYKRKVLPPTFSIAFRVQSNIQILNGEEIRNREEEIAAWYSLRDAVKVGKDKPPSRGALSRGQSKQIKKGKESPKVSSNKEIPKEGDKDEDVCPLPRIAPIFGRKFEYSVNLTEFKRAVVEAYDNMIIEFSDVSHIRKYVMEKIYFPVSKDISSVTPNLDYVMSYRKEIEQSIDKAVQPLLSYLDLFQKYESFINIDNDDYVKSKIKINRREGNSLPLSDSNHENKGNSNFNTGTNTPDTDELELPVTCNLHEVCQVIDEHLHQIQDIEESLPINPIYCGLFLVEVISVRNLLLEKHRSIIRLILTLHSKYCLEICSYLEEEFQKITIRLNKRPETIEELVELESYVTNLPMTITTLQGHIADMMSYYDILDQYKFKYDSNHTSSVDLYNRKWIIFGQPNRIQQLCADVQQSNTLIKRRLLDDMHDEQTEFIREMSDLEEDVKNLESYQELYDVTSIATRVREVETLLNTITSKSRLFNSREGLFECDVTDYDRLTRISKSFEPYR